MMGRNGLGWTDKIQNPWRQNPWFESVAVAQERARKRLPQPVYGALVAGSERGQSMADNQAAFAEIGLAPHVAGQAPERAMGRTVLGQDISMPVLISPTGVQAVHPDGEVAVARAAATRGTIMSLSNFASKFVEEVTATGATTFFQMYWTGERDVMLQRMQRAADAGAVGLIATLDWSFSMGRDWGSPEIPEKVDLATMVRMAPHVLTKPHWLYLFGQQFMATGKLPDLTAPNLRAPLDGGELGEAPTFFGAYYEWMTMTPPSWQDVWWMREQWSQISVDRPFMLKGVCRVDDARRAVDCGVDALSVSNHGGNNLDGTPATIRMVKPIADAVGSQVEVVMDGGIRRGSDVVKAIALGARAVMIGRAYLWGLAANGQAGVENVLDVLRGGIDSALMGLGVASIDELTPKHLLVPDGFHRTLGSPSPAASPVRRFAPALPSWHRSPHPPDAAGRRSHLQRRRCAPRIRAGRIDRAAWTSPPARHRHRHRHRDCGGQRGGRQTGGLGSASAELRLERRASVIRRHQLDRHRHPSVDRARAGPFHAHLGGPSPFRQWPRREFAALDGAVSQLKIEGHDVDWIPCATEVSADGGLHAGRTETSLMLHIAHGTCNWTELSPAICARSARFSR